MKRIAMTAALVVFAGAAIAQMTCIDEGYDPLTGARGHRVPAFTSREGWGTIGPDRSDPWWLEDPDRPALVQQR